MSRKAAAREEHGSRTCGQQHCCMLHTWTAAGGCILLIWTAFVECCTPGQQQGTACCSFGQHLLNAAHQNSSRRLLRCTRHRWTCGRVFNHSPACCSKTVHENRLREPSGSLTKTHGRVIHYSPACCNQTVQEHRLREPSGSLTRIHGRVIHYSPV